MMDEVLFRSSQKIETMQLQAGLTASKTKEALILYFDKGRLLVSQLWHSASVEQLKDGLRDLSTKIVTGAEDIKAHVIYIFDPRNIYRNFVKVFMRKWTKRDVCFGCAGFIIGGAIGLGIGLSLRKKEPVVRYMQAVQCSHYLGPESVTVVEDAIAPYECGENDVLINVKAASVQAVDLQICSGYGRTLRKILNNVFKQQSNSDLPVVLGRDCTGIITDIGSKVKRLEVGDEVWVAVPFWYRGTLCQTVLVTEDRVSRKPKNIGFEGACSLPYAGSIALSALEKANIDVSNAQKKRILIEGGCTPVGCVLIQLLKNWKAVVTATCLKRAVPVVKALGASDIIILSEPTHPNNSALESEERNLVENALLKELELRGDIYDMIIKTGHDCNVATKNLKKFCVVDGIVISTLPPVLHSDSYGFLRRWLVTVHINLKCRLQKMLGLPSNDFDEIHLCHVTLDRLAGFVEDGSLQTVVDKVFTPHDIEIALSHIQSPHSIGSTILTFR